jgi:hypothetical protein
MKSLKFLLPILLFFAFINASFAQRYQTAGGIRIDNHVGFTVQQYIKNDWTVEGILHAPFRSDEFGLTLLAEKHRKILFRGFNVYYGAGTHYYFESAASKQADVTTKNVFGLSFIGGAEASVGRFNIAADFKPEMHLAGDQVHPFEWNGAAISLRYIFKKRERKGIKDLPIWDKLKKNKKSKSKKR